MRIQITRLMMLGAMLGFAFAAPVMLAGAQMMDAAQQESRPAAAQANPPDTGSPPPPDAAQQKAARTFASKARTLQPRTESYATERKAILTPLSPRERVQQLLDRFTFGPQPGEVDRVLAMGEDKWLMQQMNPQAIKDAATGHRLADYPTLTMSTPQIVTMFPDRGQIYAVADGKVPYPSDPALNAIYQVQVYKTNLERDQKQADGTLAAKAELTDAQKDALKQQQKATAARIAGELFALPRRQRMAALLAMPVEDRVAFTGNGNLTYDQRNLLMAQFTPRERETFEAMGANLNSGYFIGNELAQARILRDVMTNRQLQEIMTDFWLNHFNIFIAKDSDEWYMTSFERDVIRKNALGNFHDLLLATSESPAMMVYLDNYTSIGPDSLANGVNPKNPNSKKGNRGLNENYGREVMELHTVGVNSGYSQADVTTLSAILTGWGVARPNQGGPFEFDYRKHEPGPKTWFGYTIADNGTVTPAPQSDVAPAHKRNAAVWTPGAPAWGPSDIAATPDSMKQGIAALDILAASPHTAHFICWLLAQRFVADDPPPALVDRLAKVYLASHGDIKTILRALIASPEFNSRQYFHSKVKTPIEFVASAFRSTATEPNNPTALVNTISQMGMRMYYALPPTGYYLTADQWMNSTALVDRLNFAYALTHDKYANQKFDAPKLLALGLLAPSGAADISRAEASAMRANADDSQRPAAHAAKLIGVAASSNSPNASAQAAPSAGEDVALRVLEATMIGAPVSAQTNRLIDQEMEQQKPNTGPEATLDLLTALVMGSPEFQLR